MIVWTQGDTVATFCFLGCIPLGLILGYFLSKKL